MRLRGPDGARAYDNEGISCTHTLLSLQGMIPTVQPIVLEDSSVLAWNGEVYNFEKLAQEAKINAKCDTDILIPDKFGNLDITKMRGMFAISVSNDKQTTLYRDQSGIKPLYYVTKPNGIYFGSIASDVAKLSDSKNSGINWLSIYQWIRFRSPLEGNSFYRGVKQLPPNSELTFDIASNSVKIRDLPKDVTSTEQHGLEELLIESVREHMISNSGIGFLLSGGLDSSLLAAIAKRLNGSLRTFSIAVDSETLDETPWAEKVSKHIGSAHTVLNINKIEFSEELRRLIDMYKEPCSVPNEVALSLMSGVIAREFKCVMSGEGADELFGGYSELTLLPTQFDEDKVSMPHLRKIFMERYSYLNHEQAKSLLRSHLTESEIDDFGKQTESTFESSLGDIDSPDGVLNWLYGNHLPTLLHRLDKSTMANSVEGRVPFLDQRIIHYAHSKSWQCKMGTVNGEIETPKKLLKDVALEYLPADVVHRKKIGFPIPSDYYSASTKDSSPNYLKWVELNMRIFLEEL